MDLGFGTNVTSLTNGTGASLQSGIARDVAYISELYAAGGPKPDEYGEFGHWLRTLFERYDSGLLDDQSVDTIRHAMPRAWSPETCMGRAFRKLRGYAGDFEIIDWIYQQRTTRVPELRRWDDYFHQCAAPTAVRNRKQYFKRALADRLDQHETQQPLRVLNLASGPCRDIAEFLIEKPEARERVQFVCVDQDANAISYAQRLCEEHPKSISFVQQNAFRFRSRERFDWIWSAGLFDYLDQDLFRRLLSRLSRFTAPGGQIVVGNFSRDNPSQDLMRFGEWFLHLRSAGQLSAYAVLAGYPVERVRVETEPLGVNLFLTIDAP